MCTLTYKGAHTNTHTYKHACAHIHTYKHTHTNAHTATCSTARTNGAACTKASSSVPSHLQQRHSLVVVRSVRPEHLHQARVGQRPQRGSAGSCSRQLLLLLTALLFAVLRWGTHAGPGCLCRRASLLVLTVVVLLTVLRLVLL